jgi:Fe-S cluster assembly ATPase SufC
MLRFTGLSTAYKLAHLDHNGLNFSASATHTSQKMKQLMEKRSWVVGFSGGEGRQVVIKRTDVSHPGRTYVLARH